MILAVDIGGTKTLAALFEYTQEEIVWHPVHLKRWASQDFHLDLITDFLKETLGSQPVHAAGFSLAGPIVNDQCYMVNLNRTLDFPSIRQALPQAGRIVFANDLIATAHSLIILPPSSIVSLTAQPPVLLTSGYPGGLEADTPLHQQPQPPVRFPIAVLSLGTGLGQSVLLSEESALGSEGAHADFAPNTEQQVRLWRFLKNQFGHVSYERVLSGSGLSNIYSFLTQGNPADTAANTFNATDPDRNIPTPPEITSRALSGACSLCQASLDLFIDILGAQAGNFVLQTMSLGGVCLAGGIVPHILPALRQERFAEAFLDKGRFRHIVEQTPAAAVIDDKAALLGAVRLAYLALK